MANNPYVNAVGCLMHAMVLTRLDISHALIIVCIYMTTPGKEHWQAFKWILRSLNDTQKYRLLYRDQMR